MPEIRLKREELIRNVMSKVKTLAQRFDNREPELEELKEIRDLLVSVTAYPELFPDMHFPAPEGDEIETLYEVSIEEDQSNALYVYRPGPGKVSPVHDHTTWAVVVGLEGVENNLVWKRMDDGAQPGYCELAVERLVEVGPGQGVYYRGTDIHSISVPGDKAIKHLHLYGHSLMDLPHRVDFDPVARTYRRQSVKPTIRQPVSH